MTDISDYHVISSVTSTVDDNSASRAANGATSGSGAEWAWSTSGSASGVRQVSEAGSLGEGWTAADGSITDEPPWYNNSGLTITTLAELSNSVSTIASTIAVELVTDFATAAATTNGSNMDLNRTTMNPAVNTNWTTATNWSEKLFSTDDAPPPLLRHSHLVYTLLTCFVLGAIILVAIVGNAFVIAAIVLERNLHSVANYLIASLAVADLLVAALVMPLAAVNEISSRWFFGAAACDAFVSFDVLCCTASILHLVAISVDRYWAVTRVDYIHNRPVRHIFAMIALSWAISTVISIPPLFGWKMPDDDPDVTGVCLISQDWGYTVYSTLGAFYIPLGFMIVIYLNVYRAARSRIRKKQFRRQITNSATVDSSTTYATSAVNGRRGASHRASAAAARPRPQAQLSLDTPTTPSLLIPPDVVETVMSEYGDTAQTSPTSLEFAVMDANGDVEVEEDARTNVGLPADLTSSQRLSTERRAAKKREQTRERKAARTLGIITGSFVGCWLPFFILAIVRPFCADLCHYPDLLVSVIIWLGYFNSLLNPIIYTVFNPDFRLAFSKILFGRYRGDGRGRGGGSRPSRFR